MPIARSRWKFSFGRSSSPSSPPPPFSTTSSPSSGVGSGNGIGASPIPTPMSFICPISSSLMFDPVIIPTGQTFERACIEACREFNFNPPSLSSVDISSSSSSSFLLIPNAALRAAIFDWCDRFGLPHPSPLSQQTARALVQNLILMTNSTSTSNFQSAQENSPITKTQNPNFSPPSSSSCSSYPSSSASSFSSSEINDSRTPKSTAAADPSTTTMTVMNNPMDPLEEAILIKLKTPQISVKESGLIALRHSARESSDRRISLCTPRLLSAVVPMILSKNSSIQINATAALVNLSIEPANKVKIVRSGAVPPLVDALKSSSTSHSEARDNAAGALFSLALEDENKLAIGVLGAIPPLVNLFCQQSCQSAGHLARVESGMALYHLSLAPNNLSKISKMAGAVKAILNIATAASAAEEEEEEEKTMMRLQLRRVALMVLASLARRNEGRVALMDADAVKAMVGLMMKEEGAPTAAGKEECYYYCLAIMYEMSKGSLRFRALARAAGAERVLLAMADQDNKGGDGEVVAIGKEMTTRTLKVIRGNEEKGVAMLFDDEEEEEVGSVVSDGLLSFRRRYHDFGGGNSGSNSANF